MDISTDNVEFDVINIRIQQVKGEENLKGKYAKAVLQLL